jgi:hypothetical protein
MFRPLNRSHHQGVLRCLSVTKPLWRSKTYDKTQYEITLVFSCFNTDVRPTLLGRCEVLGAALINIQVLGDARQFRSVNRYCQFRTADCLRLQGEGLQTLLVLQNGDVKLLQGLCKYLPVYTASRFSPSFCVPPFCPPSVDHRLLEWHAVNPLTPELNHSAQRCLTRFLLGILLLEPCILLIYA